MKIMKNKKIICGLIAISIVLMFFSSIVSLSGSTSLNLNNQLETSQEEIRYTEIYKSIYIDGHEEFDVFVATERWASGKGDIFDPYVIEGISMIGVQLVIKDVDFFVIRNCRFFNYSMPYGYIGFAGLSLDRCRYGTIENNIFEHCSIGLSAYHGCEDLIISRNDFLGSHDDSKTGMGKAIYITDIVSVQILENYIYAYYDGIVVFRAGKILITNNRIETIFGYISDTGIYFYYVDDSSITKNDFFGCDFGGRESTNITASGNNIPQTSTIEHCNNLTIYGNKYYDLDGNLIGEPIPFTVDYTIVIVFSVVIVLVVVCTVFIVRKKIKV
ncbi:MAG: right-handed parallel beta-helix repeat-containing protein [Candidatus Heimdallarchaeota archaeon]